MSPIDTERSCHSGDARAQVGISANISVEQDVTCKDQMQMLQVLYKRKDHFPPIIEAKGFIPPIIPDSLLISG